MVSIPVPPEPQVQCGPIPAPLWALRGFPSGNSKERKSKHNNTVLRVCNKGSSLKNNVGPFLSILFWGQGRTNFTFPFQGLEDRTSRTVSSLVAGVPVNDRTEPPTERQEKLYSDFS